MVDIVLHPAKAGVDRIRRFMTARPEGYADLDEVAAAVAAYNPDRAQPSRPAGLLRNLRRGKEGRLHWHWDPRMLDPSPLPKAPFLAAELAAISHNVTIPTLLVRGGRSDVVDDEGVNQMRALLPQTQVHEVAGAAHMVAGDRNDAFNDGVLAFLRRHLPSGRGAD